MRSYGVRTLTVTSPVQTFAEPVLLADVKTYLHIDHAHEDDNIQILITAAREYAETVNGRDLVTSQWDLTQDGWQDEFSLGDNVSSVDLVQYTGADGVDVELAEDTDYLVDLRRGLITPPSGGSWPAAELWPSSGILIRYTVTPEVPAAIKVAIMRLVSHCHVNRLPFEMVAGSPNEWPVDITRLLNIGARRLFA